MSELVRGTGTMPLGGLGGAMVGGVGGVLLVVLTVGGTARRARPADGVVNRAFALPIMSDGDDSAALWKVNRTIHELVKDRVQTLS